METPPDLENYRDFTQLEAIQRASRDLQHNPVLATNDWINPIKVLLELGNKASTILHGDRKLYNLSQSLNTLKTLLEKLEKSQGYSLKSILIRKITNYRITQVAYSIEAEIQSYIDRESIQNLVMILEESYEDDAKLKFLIGFKQRVLQGFDGDLQDLVLKAKVFLIIEKLLCEEATCSQMVKEQAALVIVSLVEFNRNVFAGLVLMGSTIQAVISMASGCSIRVLRSLVRLIKSTLIDELLSNNEIPRIIGLLSSQELEIQVAAFDCICEIAYFGRMEVIELMLNEGLIYKLVGFQRSPFGDNLINQNGGRTSEECSKSDPKMEGEDEGIWEKFPFASCVLRFAVQIEVGEGLDQREKMTIKLEILERVREASVSEAEAASIIAEVLWGSSS